MKVTKPFPVNSDSFTSTARRDQILVRLLAVFGLTVEGRCEICGSIRTSRDHWTPRQVGEQNVSPNWHDYQPGHDEQIILDVAESFDRVDCRCEPEEAGP